MSIKPFKPYYSNSDQIGEQESFVIPLDLRTKHEILNEYDELLKLYSEYRKFERLAQEYPKGWINWLVQLEKTYLRLKVDLKKANVERYSQVIKIMDDYINNKISLSFSDAVNCTLALIEFVNYLGLSRIAIFKKTFDEKLEDEL